jgi:hypothetical protein
MNSFHNPDRLVFRQSIYTALRRNYSVEEAKGTQAVSTGIAPSARTVTLLLSTSTKPPWISK